MMRIPITPSLSLTCAILGRNFIIWFLKIVSKIDCEPSIPHFDLSINKRFEDIRKFWQDFLNSLSDHDIKRRLEFNIQAWHPGMKHSGRIWVLRKLPMGSHWPPADKSHLTWVYFRPRYRPSDSSGLV